MIIKLMTFFKKHPFLFLSNMLGFLLFADMAEDVIEKEYIVVIDRWISMYINHLRTPNLNDIIIFLTNLNGKWGIPVFSLLFILFLLYKKWYTHMWFYSIVTLGAMISFISIKLIVQRVRPGAEVIVETGYSFPSGHATMATAMALAVYFIFSSRLHSVSLKLLLLFVSCTWAVGIAFSRIYLDVHWLSDVIAGLGLGLFWVTLVALFFKWRDNDFT